ncbi:MAG: TetR/AcrR family transcriptional regulator [Myxococcota bacterium]
MQLFWSQGYDATSLQQLLDSTGLSKSSLYASLGNKRSLFLKCLDRYRGFMEKSLRADLDAAPTALHFVRSTLTNVVNEGSLKRPRGCFVTNTATEFGQIDPGVAEAIAESFAHFRGVFEDAIARGQADGSIGAGDRTGLATYLITAMNGLRTMVKAGTERALLIQTVHITLHAITTREARDERLA